MPETYFMMIDVDPVAIDHPEIQILFDNSLADLAERHGFTVVPGTLKETHRAPMTTYLYRDPVGQLRHGYVEVGWGGTATDAPIHLYRLRFECQVIRGA